ncbi:MAG: FAD-binding oxidoreductase [Candidatus Elarobacter sp.]
MSATMTIAGVVPRDVATPRDGDELAAIVRELHAQRKPFAFIGGGTELELGNAPRALDTVIRMTALDRVVEYAPEDQTITLEAGITFAELDALLAQHGQMLPLDVGDRRRATIGGAIATNAFGKRRQRYGTVRDLIVGVQIVRPDGVVARGGGKVVKNVAGFDVPKLMAGSLGTLGAIATATLRVYPIPEAAHTMSYAGAIEELVRLLVRERLEPESVAEYVWYEAGSKRRETLVTFAGLESGVRAQAATLRRLAGAGGSGATVEDVEPSMLPAFDALESRVRLTQSWRVRASSAPSDGREDGWTSAAPGGPDAIAVRYPTLGTSYAAGERFGEAGGPDADPSLTAVASIAAMRAACAAVVVHAMPAQARGIVDAWGPPPPSLSLMRAMKNNFDPLGLCNPGRFIGGL